MKYCVIGFGGRGKLYSDYFAKLGAAVTAVCDKDRKRLEYARQIHGLSPDMLFERSEDFFGRGKLADLCVVGTQDSQHKEHAVAAMKAGCDLLLEKPIATTLEDCLEIQDAAKRLNRKVFVCHVLRYAPFFAAIKNELDSGKYGRVSTINLTENVAFWHQAHSYVRGNWRNKQTSSPMIIAKCCHDLDLICWFIGRKCRAVSSFGSLNFYRKENAPEGSAERCLDCKAKSSCEYDAERFYVFEGIDKGNAGWPASVLATNPTRENIYRALKESNYGKCVFRLDNDVVDHQVVNLEFEGGVTAHLTMTAFSKHSYREIHVHCEKGEIYGNMLKNVLVCNLFGKESKEINVNEFSVKNDAHGGGDINLIKDIVDFYRNSSGKGLTDIGSSMQSHVIGFAAEESRLKRGAVVYL